MLKLYHPSTLYNYYQKYFVTLCKTNYNIYYTVIQYTTQYIFKAERGMFIFYNTNLISPLICCVYSLSSLLCWALPAVRVSPLDKVIMGQQGGQYEDRFIRGLIGTNRNRMSLQQAKFGARRQLPSPFSLRLWPHGRTYFVRFNVQHDVNALRWVVLTLSSWFWRPNIYYLNYVEKFYLSHH